MASKLTECTTTASVAGYNKSLNSGSPIRRVERVDTPGCSACESLKKLQGSRITCGMCGRKH